MLQDLAFDQPVVDVQFELHIQSHEAALVLDHDVPGFLLFPFKKHRRRWLIHER